MTTVHLIFNAHIDPIWLWGWPEGVDVVLATCHSACNLLDKYPDLVFSQGEAWVFQQIEKVDPKLFRRIRQHVRSGRWEIVGGWWIQPDCNFPGGAGFQRQISIGKEYFKQHFGLFPQVAYNIDSFGHAATLPGFMQEAGQKYYVMMRPQEHEMKLPARLFRWRGFDKGPEVTTFRIAGAYCGDPSVEHIRKSLTELPPGIQHTMCYVGLGDHGGGPTERQIAWCHANADAIEGCRLVFSTPARFFKAVAKQIKNLPLVTGELQMHAIGCYTVHRSVKNAIRTAESQLLQAAVALAKDPCPERSADHRLAEAWERVCTHHFHDTLGGTCIPSAYPAVDAQLGYARAIADEIAQHAVRRMGVNLSKDWQQRIVLFNASDLPFDGYTSFEPWIDWRSQLPNLHLSDEQGQQLATQIVDCEAVIPLQWRPRLLLRLQIPPASMRVLKLGGTALPESAIPPAVQVSESRIANQSGVWADLQGRMGWAKTPDLAPRFELLDDPTDTWSHDVDRYAEGPGVLATWKPAVVVDKGPLMAAFIREGAIGDSRLWTETRVYADCPIVDVLLRVHWRARQQVLKLVLPFDKPAKDRIDGIPGYHLQRKLDGCERPVRDWSLFEFAKGAQLGIVCPDVYALDATPDRLRLTLLRSPLMAHHLPRAADALRGQVADQGVHEFRLRFIGGVALQPADLDAHAAMLCRPLIRADVTRGMGERDRLKSRWRSPGVTTWRMSALMPDTGGKGIRAAAPVRLSADLGWRSVQANLDASGFVNAHEIYGDADGIVYFANRFHVKQAGNWTLRIGHDGGIRVFVDGRNVFCEPQRVNPALPDRSTVDVRLNRGIHEIVIAFDTDHGQGWGFFMAFEMPESARKPSVRPSFPTLLANHKAINSQ